MQAEYSGLTCALNFIHSNQKVEGKGWVVLPHGLLIIDEVCGGNDLSQGTARASAELFTSELRPQDVKLSPFAPLEKPGLKPSAG